MTTNDEEQASPDTKGWPGIGSEPAQEPKSKAESTTSGESGGDDPIAKPDSDGWPGIG